MDASGQQAGGRRHHAQGHRGRQAQHSSNHCRSDLFQRWNRPGRRSCPRWPHHVLEMAVSPAEACARGRYGHLSRGVARRRPETTSRQRRIQPAPGRQVRPGRRPARAEDRCLRTSGGRAGRHHRRTRQPLRPRPGGTAGLRRARAPHVGQHQRIRAPGGSPLQYHTGTRSPEHSRVRARPRSAGSRRPHRRIRGSDAPHPGPGPPHGRGHDLPGVHRSGGQWRA